jgi:hypothetical protein
MGLAFSGAGTGATVREDDALAALAILMKTSLVTFVLNSCFVRSFLIGDEKAGAQCGNYSA